jgi:hypothetical protein
MTTWNEPAERARFEREMHARGEKCERNAKGEYIDQAMYRAWIIWEIARHDLMASQPAGVSDAWNKVRSEASAISGGRSIVDLLRAVEAYADARVADGQERGNG